MDWGRVCVCHDRVRKFSGHGTFQALLPTLPIGRYLVEELGHDLSDGIAVLTQLQAPARSIAAGDALTIRAGCEKRMETCGAKFANTANFRGFPHIPGQDAVLRYATIACHCHCALLVRHAVS